MIDISFCSHILKRRVFISDVAIIREWFNEQFAERIGINDLEISEFAALPEMQNAFEKL